MFQNKKFIHFLSLLHCGSEFHKVWVNNYFWLVINSFLLRYLSNCLLSRWKEWFFCSFTRSGIRLRSCCLPWEVLPHLVPILCQCISERLHSELHQRNEGWRQKGRSRGIQGKIFFNPRHFLTLRFHVACAQLHWHSGKGNIWVWNHMLLEPNVLPLCTDRISLLFIRLDS